MGAVRVGLKDAGVVCLFVVGLIFILYALLVPSVVSGVHWLITLAALLFLVALPAINESLRRTRIVAAKGVVALMGVAMITIVASDVSLALSLLSRFNHEVTYAVANAMFIISVIAVGILALRGVLFKWFGDLSILTGVVGLSTYLSGVPWFLPMLSLMLLGLWSLALGFNVHKLAR